MNERIASAGRRLCPTRTNGTTSLIAHWITPATCLERQRGNYHKCFTCRWQGLSASAELPPRRAPLAPPPRVAEPPPAQAKPPKPRRVEVSRAG